MNEITKKENQLPEINPESDPYLATASRALADSNFLKFVKGTFVFGPDEDELSLGMELVPNMLEARAGWLKWHDGEVVEEQMVHFSVGKYPFREDLGDLDQSEWEVDEDGRALDPWSECYTVPFKDPASGQEFTFTTSSAGGRRAVSKLIQAWRYGQSRGESGLPVVAIGADSYRHKKYGNVDFPTFTIKRWADETDLIAGEVAEDDPNDDLDDLPFA